MYLLYFKYENNEPFKNKNNENNEEVTFKKFIIIKL